MFISKIKRAFSRPHPFEISTGKKWIFIFTFGAFVFLFLYSYKPFGIDRVETAHDTLILAGYGMITIVGLMINIFFLPAVFPNFFSDEKWTVLREILYILWNFICIALLNTVYSNALNTQRIALAGFVPFIFYTFAVGLFPVTVYTFISQIYLSNKYEKLAQYTNTRLGGPASRQNSIILESDQIDERIAFDLDRLYYIKSEGNYVLFFLEKDGCLSATVLRMPISRAEHKLTGFQDLVRCHKSYIVNLQKVEHVSGNARGLRLTLSPVPACIPVSRSYIRVIGHSIQAIRPTA